VDSDLESLLKTCKKYGDALYAVPTIPNVTT